MTSFVNQQALQERKRALRDPTAIGGLASSLQRELHAALDVPVPDGKSRLTRHGGRCVRCTVLLDFDPRQPVRHACPNCHEIYTDHAHHQWWLMNAHLWTAEQCTRAAALALLLDDDRAARRADEILRTYADRYATWPNRDNALGPTRPFFSTYLESIWLLHLATALELRINATGQVGQGADAALERLVLPSARLIASFNEGRSNRQVWHCAALFAASSVLDDSSMRHAAADSLRVLLREGLHADGSWYEGENYHLFAHRGLLSAVTLAEQNGIELSKELRARFEAGFTAPFRTMLPDGTFPSRRDSQYGVALRQYRTADWAECGFARRDTPELRAALASMYAHWPDAGTTGRWKSTADAERNQPGVRLTRADCGWRALLLARPQLPPLADAVPQSELLQGQGLAVFRREAGRCWVGLDYGDPGDGHGHPDRLNLVIATRDTRLLDDVGTGSYTSPTLAWYRSSLAHNAPMVNGENQGAGWGRLRAHDEHGDIGWVSATFVDPTSGVRFTRSVVVATDHVVDELTWTSPHDVFVDVPMQAQYLDDDARPAANWVPFVPGTSQDSALVAPVMLHVPHARLMRLRMLPLRSPTLRSPQNAVPVFSCAVFTAGPAILWRAGTIGPPAGESHGLVSLRQRGESGRSVRIICWPGVSADVVNGDRVLSVEMRDGSLWRHRADDSGWYAERVEPNGRSETFALSGFRTTAPEPTTLRATEPAAGADRIALVGELSRDLGPAHYRMTEESWMEAGEPSAHVRATHAGSEIRIAIDVALGRAPAFAPAVADNPLDNELADVNSDGVQLHWRSPLTKAWNGVIAVPDGAGVRLAAAAGARDGLTARWERAPAGYSMHFTVPWPQPDLPFCFDCIVNERPAARERRRGQLVLSGAAGETAYLRGARQPPDRAICLVFDPTQS